MSELNRSDPKYVEKALDQVFINDTAPEVLGINVGFAPETLEELSMLVKTVRDAKCSVSRDIDEFVLPDFINR